MAVGDPATAQITEDAQAAAVDVAAAAAAVQGLLDGLEPEAPAVRGKRGTSATRRAAQQPAATSMPPKRQLPTLGSSGAAAFVAAAKALRAPRVNRALLSGCLEAAQQEAEQLRTQIAKRQLARELGGGVAAGGPTSGRGGEQPDPYAKPLQQLREDLARLRVRAEHERASVQQAAVVDVVRSVLPLLDSFDAAVATQAAAEARSGPPPEGEAAIHAAYRALHTQLLALLRCEPAPEQRHGVRAGASHALRCCA